MFKVEGLKVDLQSILSSTKPVLPVLRPKEVPKSSEG